MFELYTYFRDMFPVSHKNFPDEGVISGRSLRRLVLEGLVASSSCTEDLEVGEYLPGNGGRGSLPIWLAHG